MPAQKFWSFLPANKAGDNVAELLLYEEISSVSWWGDEVTPKSFSKDLKALGDVEEIRVRINSPGGCVFAAVAIYNMLRANGAKITVVIDGIAASAATIVMMAGDVIQIPINAIIMLHEPWTYARGNINDFKKISEVLEKTRLSIIRTYQTKVNMTEEEIGQILTDEAWYLGEEAVEKGFCTELLSDEVPIAASLIEGEDSKVVQLVSKGKTFEFDTCEHPSALFFVNKIQKGQKGASVTAMPKNVTKVAPTASAKTAEGNGGDSTVTLTAQEYADLQNTIGELRASVATLQAATAAAEEEEDEEDEGAQAQAQTSLMAQASPEIQALIKAMVADKKKAERELNAMKEKETKALYDTKAAALDKLPLNKDQDWGGVLQQISLSSPEAFNAVYALLTQLNNCQELGTVFAEAGASTGKSEGLSSEEQLKNKAKEIALADTALSFQQAYALALKKNPELYSAYLDEIAGQ